jgi:hypothetical protein
MVRRVKLPQVARHVFSHFELSGWQEGIAYEPRDRRPKKRKEGTVEALSLPPVVPKCFRSGFRCA